MRIGPLAGAAALAAAAVWPRALPEEGSPEPGWKVTNIAAQAGLKAPTIYGGEKSNRYLVETTGCGVALIDYDGDGWLDIYQVNGSRFENLPAPQPRNHLYRNNRDGTFSDVTARAGVGHSGWGQAVLYRNNGDGTFTDVTRKAGLVQPARRWNSGCAFVDYDRDGDLDLFVANYIDFDPEATPTPDSGLCLYKGIRVACGPPGLQGGKNILYRNNGDGTFTDVSEASGVRKAHGTYGLGVMVFDFDNDGWPDIYVANDSNPSALYRNNHDGTFTDIGIASGCAYSADGKPQAGMGVAAGDFDRDGWFDIF
ncbi:MAG: RNA-binding protein, partial [Acidobacteria bacterium]